MSSPSSKLPYKPRSVGISQFFPVENYSLPMSPAIYQWLDVKTDILQGKGSLGKSQRALAYVKGQYPTISDNIRQYPRLPTLSAGRYLPVDAGTLFSCPRGLPRGIRCTVLRVILFLWHFKCPSKKQKSSSLL